MISIQSTLQKQPINFDDDNEVDHALGTAVRAALLRHKRLGQSVVVWQDGKIVTLAPEDIPDHFPDETS